MIRRCKKLVEGGRRCKRPEHDTGACNTSLIGHWCASCRDYRPAGDMQFCGECGGRHARSRKAQQPLQVYAEPKTKRQKLALRKRRLMERAVVLRREGRIP